MPEIVIQIGGRDFTVACQEGEEPYLRSAAQMLDTEASVVIGQIGRMPSERMLLMAGLMLADKTAGLEEDLQRSEETLRARAAALTPRERPGDYAQAVMDLGATICSPRNPACGICPWRAPCAARAAGTAPDLPKKSPKKDKPTRYGTVYVGRRADGAWLVETRPDKGLLGGMMGWPGTEWADTAPDPAPPCPGDWRDIGAEVRHTFTHFHLILRVRAARLPQGCAPARGFFLDRHAFRPSDLPTVMRKAFDLAREA
jgi:A/G-specific adenine glycosylase